MYQYPDREKLVTGLTFVYNEVEWIEDCILSHIPFFDDIIAYDGSNDGTIEVLKKYCSLVLKESGTVPFNAGPIRNLLLDKMSTPWGWFFTADERLKTTMTPEEMRNLIKFREEGSDVLRLRRFNRCGPDEKQGYQFPDFQGNIAKKTVRYSTGPHEMPDGRHYNLADEPIEIDHLMRACDGDKRCHTRWDNFDTRYMDRR